MPNTNSSFWPLVPKVRANGYTVWQFNGDAHMLFNQDLSGVQDLKIGDFVIADTVVRKTLFIVFKHAQTGEFQLYQMSS